MPTELRIFLSEEGTDIERLDRLTPLGSNGRSDRPLF